MKDFSKYKQVGRTSSSIMYTAESDPDILITVPQEGTRETVKDAHDVVAFYYSYAQTLGRPCSAVVIMANLLSQEAESRRAYAGIDPKKVFAAGLVVENALSRALGSFFIGLTRPVAPTRLFDSVESAVEWLKTMRPKPA
jgi:hypothetical protein